MTAYLSQILFSEMHIGLRPFCQKTNACFISEFVIMKTEQDNLSKSKETANVFFSKAINNFYDYIFGKAQ